MARRSLTQHIGRAWVDHLSMFAESPRKVAGRLSYSFNAGGLLQVSYLAPQRCASFVSGVTPPRYRVSSPGVPLHSAVSGVARGSPASCSLPGLPLRTSAAGGGHLGAFWRQGWAVWGGAGPGKLPVSTTAVASWEEESKHAMTIEVFKNKKSTSFGPSSKKFCFGCGAQHTAVAAATGKRGQEAAEGALSTAARKEGYWAEHKRILHISKRQNWALCARCRQLREHEKRGTLEAQGSGLLASDPRALQVFRQEVSLIRAREDVVVVYCVDAVNVSGTVIRTLREYVGGNPLLLAVTRCDLLPPHLWEGDRSALASVFADRAADLQAADVFLCAVPPSAASGEMDPSWGVGRLKQQLAKHLHGRDVYIVGAANIGKSTLTDVLVSGLVEDAKREAKAAQQAARRRGRRDAAGEGPGQAAEERRALELEEKRLNSLQHTRVTRSALPGTTLQNVRVPCFRDHTQALWDTPGLVLEHSTAHFPMRRLQELRRQRPAPICPQLLELAREQVAELGGPERSVVLRVCEPGDPHALLRLHVRLLPSCKEGGPELRFVWNSILPLEVSVEGVEAAREAGARTEARGAQVRESVAGMKAALKGEFRAWRALHSPAPQEEDKAATLTPEEKAEAKARRKKANVEAFERFVEHKRAELGMEEWERLQAEEMEGEAEVERLRALSALTEVKKLSLEAGAATDIVVQDFGWLGVLPSCKVEVRVAAPSSGVRVSSHPTLGLPSHWPWARPSQPDVSGSACVPSTELGSTRTSCHRGESVADPWAEHRGEHVGWKFLGDVRGIVHPYGSTRQDGWYPLTQKDIHQLAGEATGAEGYGEGGPGGSGRVRQKGKIGMGSENQSDVEEKQWKQREKQQGKGGK